MKSYHVPKGKQAASLAILELLRAFRPRYAFLDYVIDESPGDN